MLKGKETCKILKQIRQNIASENDIPLVVEECHYKGECRGTCPRCEAELHYLEKELMKRRSMGKKIVLAGLSAGLSWSSMIAEENVSNATVESDTLLSEQFPVSVVVSVGLDDAFPKKMDGTSSISYEPRKKCPIQVTGKIKDSSGEPLWDAVVSIRGTQRGVLADRKGNYSIDVNPDDVLEFSYFGYKTGVVKVRANSKKKEQRLKLDIVLEDGGELVEGLVVMCSASPTLDEGTKRVRGLKVPQNGADLKPRPLIQTDEYRSKDGKRDLQQDILFNKAYPIVKEMGQEVKVKVQFIINENHSLSDFKILSTDDERFNEAAMETLKRMDGWQCRKRNGRIVKTKKTVTISYTKEELMRIVELEDK